MLYSGNLPFAWAKAVFSVPQKDTLLIRGAQHLSLTRQGQVLVSDNRSTIFLLDSLGTILFRFSPRRPGAVHLIEAWNGLRHLVFYRDFQEFALLDRFLLSEGPSLLQTEKTGYVRLLAPALDGNLWALDESNFQLRKIETQSQNTLFSTPLDLILSGNRYDLSFMREYQNQLYVADRQGSVLVFDPMGNFRKKIPLLNCEWLGFWGEEVYASDGDTLRFFHPFQMKIRKQALPEAARKSKKVLKMKSGLFWIAADGLHRMNIPVRDP
jgi:hypothetical protein